MTINKFTWVDTYKAIATKLRTFRDKQAQLFDFLQECKSHNLPTISVTDKDDKGNNLPLSEIDPFTFFANFNRGVKDETRINIIRLLLERWKLNCSIPSDFSGIPVVNNQQARFIVFKKDRGDQDVSLLWDIFEQALDNRIVAQTFNTVLRLKLIHYNITMGLFWISADRYLNLDNVNRTYLLKKGIEIKGLPNFDTYVGYIEKTRNLLKKPFFEISHAAWIDKINKGPDKKENGQKDKAIRYWLFAPGHGGEHWDEFHKKGIMAIGWDHLGDLRKYASKKKIAEAIRVHDDEPDSSKKNNATSCFNFLKDMKPGDIVFAKIGRDRIIGRGIIQSDYNFDDSRSYYKHVRHVQWQKKGEWKVSKDKHFAIKTITEVTGFSKFVDYLVSLVNDVQPPPPPSDYSIEQCAEAIGFPTQRIKKWHQAIERKGQAVFYGPPGTGKTFISEHIAKYIVGGSDGFIDLIQFHPAYAYEEFMQGIRPVTDERGNLIFELKEGRFLSFCNKARQCAGPCVLIIDEINRANLSRIFGELMYLLEYRNKDIPLAGGRRFSIPPNVKLIGTMNTADRSIALVDFALRRRFAFIELTPEYEVLLAFQKKQGFNAGGLVSVLNEVNTKINDKNFSLGISFFMVENLARKIEHIWAMEIEPYLDEYFFSQPEAVHPFKWTTIKGRIGV